ncbi:MAG: hypothetical protein JWQ65_3056 [Devosia sp.]|nr:hypothetical protein [Devosia sp.]
MTAFSRDLDPIPVTSSANRCAAKRCARLGLDGGLRRHILVVNQRQQPVGVCDQVAATDPVWFVEALREECRFWARAAPPRGALSVELRSDQEM